MSVEDIEPVELGQFTLVELLDRALLRQEAIEAGYHQLAQSIDAAEALEHSTARHRTARNHLLTQIGQLIFSHWRDGGVIHVTDDDDQNQVSPQDIDALDVIPKPSLTASDTKDTPNKSSAPVIVDVLIEEPNCSEQDESSEQDELRTVPPREDMAALEDMSASEDTPPPIPPSIESLQALESHGMGTQWSSQCRLHERREERRHRILGALPKLKPISSPGQANTTLQALRRLKLQLMTGLSAEDHKQMMGLLAAWARVLQNHLQNPVQIDSFFKSLTEHSERERPGYVNGLNRAHTAKGQSWYADAEHFLALLKREPLAPTPTPEHALQTLKEQLSDHGDIRPAVLTCLESVGPQDPRLVKLLRPHLNRLNQEPRLKPLRKAIRQKRSAPSDEAKHPAWLHRAHTEGMRVLLLGGDGRRQMTTQLKSYFGFENVQWVGGKNVRRVQQLKKKINSGNIDLCLLLDRFISHKAAEPIRTSCRQNNVPMLEIGGGSGIERTRQQLQLLFGRDEE